LHTQFNDHWTDEYCHRISELKLWYIWRLVNLQDHEFEEALAWTEMSELGGRNPELLREIESTITAMGQDAFIRRALDIAGPFLQEGYQREEKRMGDRWIERPYGPIRYEFRPSFLGSDPEECLTLHFWNNMQPDSPFRYLARLEDWLDQAVRAGALERPDVKTVQMVSWLNALPPFYRIFPETWHRNGIRGRPGSHLGWWGQFMDRTGGFHVENAERFKEAGIFPFQDRLCRCKVSGLLSHLGAIISQRGVA